MKDTEKEEKRRKREKKIDNLVVNFEKFYEKGRLVLLAIGAITGLGYIATHGDEIKEYQREISNRNREQYEDSIDYNPNEQSFDMTTKDGQKINVLR